MKKILQAGWKFLNYLVITTLLIFSISLISSSFFGNEENIPEWVSILFFQFPMIIAIPIAYILLKKITFPFNYAFWFGWGSCLLMVLIAFYLEDGFDKVLQLDWVGNIFCSMKAKGCYGDGAFVFLYTIWPSYYFIGAIIGLMIDFVIKNKNKK